MKTQKQSIVIKLNHPDSILFLDLLDDNNDEDYFDIVSFGDGAAMAQSL